MEEVGVLIVGAGPTGLGAATRLNQTGHRDWLLVDQAPAAGGLACTDTTPEGFLFDMGGHVIFSHYQYFDELLDAAVGAGPQHWNVLPRVSYVWIRGRYVAYPLQNNISALPVEDQITCLGGLVDAKVESAIAQGKPRTFDEWILRTMGRGLADIFMRPYNFKVWAVPTTDMQCDWLGERVAAPDCARAISNVLKKVEDGSWGPNAVFRYPKHGGTGAIWTGAAALLPTDRCRYGPGHAMIGLDLAAKVATFANGAKIKYGSLLTTVPLDITLRWVGRPDLAAKLTHSSSHIVGVGVRGMSPHGAKCWLYYPEPDCPFYRATVFSLYADANCPSADVALPTLCLGDGSPVAAGAAPAPGPYWSLMFEIAESSLKPVDSRPVSLAGRAWPAVVRDTLLGAVATTLLPPGAEVVSLYHRRLEHGYPTPSLGRDAALAESLPLLRASGVWSRGRFGSYKYEVANQDHSLMLGVEAADNIAWGGMEVTLAHPNIVNAGPKNVELLYNGKGSTQGK